MVYRAHHYTDEHKANTLQKCSEQTVKGRMAELGLTLTVIIQCLKQAFVLGLHCVPLLSSPLSLSLRESCDALPLRCVCVCVCVNVCVCVCVCVSEEGVGLSTM